MSWCITFCISHTSLSHSVWLLQQVGTDCCKQSLEHRNGRMPWQNAGNHRGFHKPPQCCVVMLAGLEQAGRMRSGETVLVTAAAGGTGQFAVQLAKLAGNQVVATCGSDDKARLLTDLGCDRVINYNKEQPKVVHFKLTPAKLNQFGFQSCRCACQDIAVQITQPCTAAHICGAVLHIAFVPWQSAATLQGWLQLQHFILKV